MFCSFDHSQQLAMRIELPLTVKHLCMGHLDSLVESFGSLLATRIATDCPRIFHTTGFTTAESLPVLYKIGLYIHVRMHCTT